MSGSRAVLLTMIGLVTACAGLEPYRVPHPIGDYATIELQSDSTKPGGKSEAFYILGVDRRRLDRHSWGLPDATGTVSKKVITLAPGTHMVHVRGCDQSAHFLLLVMLGPVLICGETILTFDAIGGENYLIHGLVSKSKDYAEFWIIERRSSQRVVGPQRVSGLDRR